MTDADARYALIQLLDHQLIDCDGTLSGKVDDAEIVIAPDGTAVLDALLSGPGVLASRVGRRYGAWREALERALEPNGRAMTRIPVTHIRSLGVAITLSIPRDRLASTGTERWVDEHIIGRLPGARHG